MGVAAELGISRFLRQSLIGGDYELIDRFTYAPNPDFFAAVLQRRLAGTAVLASALEPAAADVRVHAYCTAGSTADVTLVAVNFGASAVALAVPATASPRKEWHIRSAVAGVVNSTVVELMAPDGAGWTPLGLTATDELTAMPPAPVPSGMPVALGPHSYAYVVLRGLAPAACAPAR